MNLIRLPPTLDFVSAASLGCRFVTSFRAVIDQGRVSAGDPVTSHHSVSSLRKRGKHIQVGILVGEHCDTKLPMDKVVANELEIYGSHGIQAYRYGAIFNLITQKNLNLAGLIGQTVSLEEGVKMLARMDQFADSGITIINRF